MSRLISTYLPRFSTIPTEAMNNRATQTARGRDISAAYPAYVGTRVTGQAGSYHVVMYLFICIGLLAMRLLVLGSTSGQRN